MDNILDIVLGTFQAKGFDFVPQLLDDPLLDSDFLEDRLIGVICNMIIWLHIFGNDCHLRLDLLDLLVELVVLDDEPPPVFGSLEV